MSTGEDAFIKLSCVADEGLLGVRVVEQPPLVVVWVAHEHALLRMRLQALALVLLHVDVRRTPKASEVGDVQFLAKEGRVGGVVLERGRW